MTDRELMQKALEALNRSDYLGWQLNIPIIKALRERLAQPEQEPVAWAHKEGLEAIKDFDASIYANGGFDDAVPLYTTPPQRKPLTDEEIERACVPLGAAMLSFSEVARAIEAAHGIKE